MGRLDGKVAFITGVARGQGRSHAIALANEGASIIGIDVCEQLPTVKYPMSTPDDLAETVRLVEECGQKIQASIADVRDFDAVKVAVGRGMESFGRLDIVLANAGIWAISAERRDDSRQAFIDSVDVMLKGAWNTLQATVPRLISGGRGGSIVITSSAAGLRAQPSNFDGGMDGYFAAKFGVVGLMRGYANALGKHNIRVNTVHPTGVATPMVMNEEFAGFLEANPDVAQRAVNSLPVEVVEAIDISNAILFLVSDEGRYITGTTLPVDAGMTNYN